jgi:hypothetical protein
MRSAGVPGRMVTCGARLVLAASVLGASTAHAHEGDEQSIREPPPAVTTGAPGAAPNLLRPAPLKMRPPHHSPWPWALIGVGALGVGAGAWLAYRDDHDGTPACTELPNGRASCPLATSTAWQGWSFVVVGAELAAVGIVWRIVESRRLDKQISLVTGLGDLRLIGRF